MNHPELCQRIEALGYYLKFDGHLPRDVYRFIVLAVARETNTPFEWFEHIKHALDAGLPQNVIETLKTQGVSSPNFSNPYRLAAQILKKTLNWKNIPDKLQTEALKEYGMHGFVGIVVLSGFYQMFSAINQAFDIAQSVSGLS